MNKLKLFLPLVIFICFVNISAQEINFDNLSFGGVVQYTAPGGDFGKFWNNAPGAGLVLNYKLIMSISFEGTLSLSYFTPKDNEDKYPKVILLNMPAGLLFRIKLSEEINTNLTAGISNTTIAYRGEAAKRVEENDIESEFGVFFSVGFETSIKDFFNLEIFSLAQTIFTSPENIALYNFGIKFLFN